METHRLEVAAALAGRLFSSAGDVGVSLYGAHNGPEPDAVHVAAPRHERDLPLFDFQIGTIRRSSSVNGARSTSFKIGSSASMP